MSAHLDLFNQLSDEDVFLDDGTLYGQCSAHVEAHSQRGGTPHLMPSSGVLAEDSDGDDGETHVAPDTVVRVQQRPAAKTPASKKRRTVAKGNTIRLGDVAILAEPADN